MAVLLAPPRIDPSSAALRAGNSEAFLAAEEIKLKLGRAREPLWLLAQGSDFEEVARRFERIAPELEAAEQAGEIGGATLPSALLPRPGRQAANREALAGVAARQGELERSAAAAGFSTEALVLTSRILAVWREAAATAEQFLPREETGRWILERVLAQGDGSVLGLGLVYPPEQGEAPPALLERLRGSGVLVAGWELLGREVYEVVRRSAALMTGLIGGFVVACLWLAFGRLASVLLSLAALGLSGLLLLALMSLMDWRWNLMNLMAIPLLAGVGLDYTIHVQSALERHRGSVAAMRRTTGRALFLCAATTACGFGSLAWSGNAGLSSLGMVCATGIACAWAVSAWLLPAWWLRLRMKAPA
jgi:predicted exporter